MNKPANDSATTEMNQFVRSLAEWQPPAPAESERSGGYDEAMSSVAARAGHILAKIERRRDRDAEREANARLIAAAPEMLDLLKYALPALEARLSREGDGQMYAADSRALRAARALIAKVEGEG